MLNVGQWTVFHGPNPYAIAPVCMGVLELGEQANPDILLSGCRRLQSLWPQWVTSDVEAPTNMEIDLSSKVDTCLLVSRVALRWALSALNEVRGYLHTAGCQPNSAGVTLWIEYHEPALSLQALSLALRIIITAGQDSSFKVELVDEHLNELWRACRRHHPDFQARILMSGARKMGIPVLSFPAGMRCWQYGWGARSRVFFETASNTDGLLGGRWQTSKPDAKALFRALGLPTPAYQLIQNEGELESAARKIGWPCVIKPSDRGAGKGVTTNIQDYKSLRSAYDEATRCSDSPVLMESNITGDVYRLMVVDGHCIAVVRGEPAQVVGDGVSTVRSLVEKKNIGRTQNMVLSRYRAPLPVDDLSLQALARQGLHFDDVPALGQCVVLRAFANRPSGGDCIDVTGEAHPQIILAAELLAKAFSLSAMGIDYISTDIRLPIHEAGGSFLEVNATPGLAVLAAADIDPDWLASKVLGTIPGRIPMELHVCNEVDGPRVLEQLRARVVGAGTACVLKTRLWLDQLELAVDDTEAWSGVRSALRNPLVQRLLIVANSMEITRWGFPVDKFDSVILWEGESLPLPWKDVAHRITGRLRANVMP